MKRKYTKKNVSRKRRRVSPTTVKKTMAYTKGRKTKFSRKFYGSAKKLNIKPIKTGTGHWLHRGLLTTAKKGSTYKLAQGLERFYSPSIILNSYSYQLAPAAGALSAGIVGSVFTPKDLENYIINYTSTGAAAASNKVLIKDYELRIFLTNQTNAPAFVDLYSIVNRRDTSSDTLQALNPYGAWASTIINQSGTTSSAIVGGTPFDNPVFTMYYKVKRITRLNLALGETAEYYAKQKINRVWNHAIDITQLEDTTTLESNEGGFKDFTGWVMAVVHGAAADSSNSTVSTAQAAVDFVTTVRYTVQGIEGTNFPNFKNTVHIGNAASEIMDTGTGTAQAVAVA